MARLSGYQDIEEYRRNVERLKSAICVKQIILPKYQIKNFPKIFQCQICGYKADTRHISCILSHLHDKHDINRGDRRSGPSDKFVSYVEKYFGNPKCACGCGKSVRIHKRRLEYLLFADDCDNSRRYASPACPEFYLFKGYSVDETVKMVSSIQSKSMSSSRRAKLSRQNMGHKNPASLPSICRRTGFDIETIREMLSLKTSGKNNGFYGKKHKEETLARLAILRSLQSKFVTKPELILYGILAGNNIEFSYQVPIGRYVVDFLVGNVVIEVYGDYWHSEKIEGGRKKRKDQVRTQYLKGHGYLVLEVWESQLINKDTNAIQKILKCVSNQ